MYLMIKTLRITGVAAVAFAGVVLASVLGPVSVIHLDNRSDEKMGKILAAPGAVDGFRDLHAGKDQANQDTTPPLVKQAETFKNIIDPKPTTPVGTAVASTTTVRGGPTVKPPVPPSQKFMLLGTAYSPSNPSSSFAYVRFQDNTCQWVPCGSEVGHIVIKEIREDSVVCWDGHRESEVAMEVVPDRASLLEVEEDASASEPVEAKIIGSPSSPPQLSNRSVLPTTRAVAPRMTDDELQSLGDLANKIKKLHGSLGDDDPAADANRVAAVNRLMSEFKSSRVSPQETKKLEDLGDEPSREKEQAREEQKREFIRKLNAARTSKN